MSCPGLEESAREALCQRVKQCTTTADDAKLIRRGQQANGAPPPVQSSLK